MTPIVDAPIPGSFLRGGVSTEYVTISGPSAKVIMATRDAHALMHWMYEALPPLQGRKPILARRHSAEKTLGSRAASYSDLWLRRRLSA